jgi:Pyridoxamine 5'-phosphate oxidase
MPPAGPRPQSWPATRMLNSSHWNARHPYPPVDPWSPPALQRTHWCGADRESGPGSLPGIADDSRYWSCRVGDGGRARHDPAVNFVVDGDTIVFSTSEGEKPDAVREGRILTFEVDDVELALRTGWSVLVVGSAEVITRTVQIQRIEQLQLAPWVPLPDRMFVRIPAAEITGRRLPLHPGKITLIGRAEPQAWYLRSAGWPASGPVLWP